MACQLKRNFRFLVDFPTFARRISEVNRLKHDATCMSMRSSDRACALTQYELRRPDARSTIASDVAEIFTVKAGKIDSLSIYFDRAPFPK
jgi:hypothetical protein